MVGRSAAGIDLESVENLAGAPIYAIANRMERGHTNKRNQAETRHRIFRKYFNERPKMGTFLEAKARCMPLARRHHAVFSIAYEDQGLVGRIWKELSAVGHAENPRVLVAVPE